jgi:(1->4)-alpha-D-glucan 1-alpha-D-glucosylmutase
MTPSAPPTCERDASAPDDIERYFIFQTLVGAWPIEAQRVEAYMIKALREAKRNTNWVEQNDPHEQAVIRFCRAILEDDGFMARFQPFAERVAVLGDRAALGQLALKLTATGVPDIYQGDELAFRALVDPDNRRPVDWEWRQAMLKRLMGGSAPVGELWKMFLIMRLLGLRGRRPNAFAGGYEPLDAGPGACAFVRGGDVLVVVSIRSDVDGILLDAPGGQWRDLLSGEERSFSGRPPVSRVVGEQGVGVFERIS